MDSVQCEYGDCVVLIRALRNWVDRYCPADCARVKAEIRQLIDMVERAGPRDAMFHGRLDAARSLIVLGRLSDALDCVDTLLRVVQQTERSPTRRPITARGWRP
ncbi:hypothetical protein [Paraburkholderia sp. 32]|uniref:hypothetical protein n=1 Tax=unclassified Paraburkholderia TaxID=2615204 RepID=UPI003D230868